MEESRVMKEPMPIGQLRGYAQLGDLVLLIGRGMSNLTGFYYGSLPHNSPVAIFGRSEKPEDAKWCDKFHVDLEDGLTKDCQGAYETKKYREVRRKVHGQVELRTLVSRRRNKKITHFQILQEGGRWTSCYYPFG